MYTKNFVFKPKLTKRLIIFRTLERPKYQKILFEGKIYTNTLIGPVTEGMYFNN